MALIFRGLLAALVAVALAGLGALAALLLTALVGDVVGTGQQEGALGMAGVMGAMPLGGIAGAGFGLWLGWRTGGKISARRSAAITLPILAAAAGLALWLWPLLAPPPPRPIDPFEIQGARPMVELQVRLDRIREPGGISVLWRPILHSRGHPRLVGWAHVPERVVDSVSIFNLRVELSHRHAGRVLELRWNSAPEGAYLFDLPFGEVPTATADFGPWRRVDRVAEGGAVRPAPADLAVHVRWRVTVDPDRVPSN